MIDRTTKLLLAAIALGLFTNAISHLFGPASAKASDGAYKCSGSVTVNAHGATESSLGGYDVDVKCRPW